MLFSMLKFIARSGALGVAIILSLEPAAAAGRHVDMDYARWRHREPVTHVRIVRNPATDVARLRVTHWDRSNPRWWRGRPEFIAYVGPRPGYFFAPGYGYYPVRRAYIRRAWVAGVPVPFAMRRYVVLDPGFYGLAPARPGYRWIYIDNNIALVRDLTGVIVRVLPRIW